MKKIKKIGVMTSGGDSPGMNAAIRSVVRTCAFYEIECVGIYRGYEGMIEGDFTNLDARSVKGIINKGGTFLKSARSHEFRTKEGRQKAYNALKSADIDGIVTIGGDGTFTGALIFNEEFGFPVMGIPGTIDNDIFGTSHTLGYDTALNTVVEVIDKIRDTASSHNRLFFIEVMGRDAGHIALSAGIAGGADVILIPEIKYTVDGIIKKLNEMKKRNVKHSLIVVAEAVKKENGELSLQIVEMNQINTNSKHQKAISKSSTHFNPVDLVCGIRDYKGEKYDLEQFVDLSTHFVAVKNKYGKKLKTLERLTLSNASASSISKAVSNSLEIELIYSSFRPL